MNILTALPSKRIVNHNSELTPPWNSWLNTLQVLASCLGANGSTANRPVSNLFVGYLYFDTTLGKPVWCKTTGSSPVWVDATGATV